MSLLTGGGRCTVSVHGGRALEEATGEATVRCGTIARPVTPALGVELCGVDLSSPDARQAAAMPDAVERHGAILARGQRLGPDDLVAFSRRIGALDEAPLPAKLRRVAARPALAGSSTAPRSGKPLR